MITYFTTIASPVGPLLLAGDGEALTSLQFVSRQSGESRPSSRWVEDETPFHAVIERLANYFDGEVQTFDVPVRARGTEFETEVWQELRRIPYGETASYSEIAARIGRPSACRAVGAANRKNPVAIIVPCHRVVGADGSLVGFAGGVTIKKKLLELEARQRRLWCAS